MIGADSVFVWTGANNPGYGDPLARAPQAVADDVRAGRLDPRTATRVYAVAWSAEGMLDEGALDEAGTARLRADRLRARLRGARPPAAAPRLLDQQAEVRQLGGELGVLVEDGLPVEWVSLSGRARLGPVTGGYASGCAVLEGPLNAAEPEFDTRPDRPGAEMLLRQYLCPVSGRRLGVEIIRAGDEPVTDMVLAGGDR
jgi:N-methylhydantoinase B